MYNFLFFFCNLNFLSLFCSINCRRLGSGFFINPNFSNLKLLKVSLPFQISLFKIFYAFDKFFTYIYTDGMRFLRSDEICKLCICYTVKLFNCTGSVVIDETN